MTGIMFLSKGPFWVFDIMFACLSLMFLPFYDAVLSVLSEHKYVKADVTEIGSQQCK